MKLDTTTLSKILFSINWESDGISHREDYLAEKVNLWRDVLSHALQDALMDLHTGDMVSVGLGPDEIFGPRQPENIKKISLKQFQPHGPVKVDRPRPGRFYPGGFFRGIGGLFPESLHPVRIVEIQGDSLIINTNHPLAGMPLTVEAKILDVKSHKVENGGRLSAWIEDALNSGPGMQARWYGKVTDFSMPDAYKREDETGDCSFYKSPRLVDHIDDQAKSILSEFHGNIIPKESIVLDLMSSMTTHLPGGSQYRVTGLGMNREEMESNPMLEGFLIHDLNSDPTLPFTSDTFDAVICSLSIEYLTRHEEVLSEVSRVLRPGGKVAISFSNRWFSPKIIKLWTQLHEFERLGWTLELLRQTGRFEDIRSFTSRNWPRPLSDRYSDRLNVSDPVYAVTGVLIET